MTNSYALIRRIAAVPDMSYAEKFAAAIIALHLNREKNEIMVRQVVIAQECGLSERTIRNAVAKMAAAGIVAKLRRQSGLVLVPQLLRCEDSGKESVYIDDRHSPAGPTGTAVPVTCISANKKRSRRTPPEPMPWEFDPAMTTRAEEEDKRARASLYRAAARRRSAP